MSTVFIYNPYKGSFGISVIVDNLAKAFTAQNIEVEIIDKLEGVSRGAIVIPYALDGAIEMIDKGYKTDYVFMADAFTLGYLNKIKFYLRHLNFLHYDYFYSMYCLIRDYRLENRVIKNFKNTLLVSQTDIDFLRKRQSSRTNYICLPNGANFDTVETKTTSNKLRLGIMSSWKSLVSASENGWFIEEYYSKYVQNNPNVELILAGRGEYIHNYSKYRQVTILGEVDNLNEFFKNIDIFISVNPKGCGILNRVLDAFAYKTAVLGYSKSFSGFKYMRNAYLEFDNYDSFKQQMDYLIANPQIKNELSTNAYKQILEFNDWEKVYYDFISKHFKSCQNFYK